MNTNSPIQTAPVRGTYLVSILVVLAILGVVVALLGNGGFVYLFQLPYYLGIGWVFFLGDAFSKVRWDPVSIISGVVVITAFTLGLHLYLKSMRGAERAWPWRWTISIVGLTLVLFVSGTATVGLWEHSSWLVNSKRPLIWRSIGFERVKYSNNLRNVGTASHNFHGDFMRFPTATTFDSHGTMLHGWQAQLLPYIEEQYQFSRIDFDLPWNHPRNAPVFQEEIMTFCSPRRKDTLSADGFALSHFAGNQLLLDKKWSLAAIANAAGTTNTLFATDSGKTPSPWGHPRNVRDPRLPLDSSPKAFGENPGLRYVSVLMCDGSVRTLYGGYHVINEMGDPNREPVSWPRDH